MSDDDGYDSYYDSYEENYDIDDEEYGDVHTENGLSLSGYISRKKSYDVFDEDELVESSMKTVKETKECLELTSEAITIVILKHFKWNKELTIEKFIELGKSKIFKLVGYVCGKLRKPKEAEYECSICFCDYPASETYSLGCKDRFCKGCWGYYLEQQIEAGLSCTLATCPNSKCNFIVKEKTYKKFLSEKSYKTYRSYVAQSFVVDDPHVRISLFHVIIFFANAI